MKQPVFKNVKKVNLILLKYSLKDEFYDNNKEIN